MSLDTTSINPRAKFRNKQTGAICTIDNINRSGLLDMNCSGVKAYVGFVAPELFYDVYERID